MNKLQTKKLKKNKPTKIASQEDQFQREWERIQNLKKQNESLRDEIESFFQQFNSAVAPTETMRLELIHGITHKLIGFLGRKSLTDTLTDMLVNCIYTNLSELQHTHFSHTTDIASLESYLADQFQVINTNRKEKFLRKLSKQGVPEDEIKEAEAAIDDMQNSHSESEADENEDDILEDLFAEFAEEIGFNDAQEPFEDETFWEEAYKNSSQSNRKDAELKDLLKATPINALFRKVTRVLHPDLEQNSEKKEEKHQLMSQLIDARDNKDIPTILNLYQKYVGALPEGLFKGNFEKLTKLLKHQTQKLKEEKHNILFEDSVKGDLYNTFKEKTAKKTEKNIQEYIKHTKQEIRELQKTKDQITSIPRLKQYIEDRYYSNAFFGDDIPF